MGTIGSAHLQGEDVSPGTLSELARRQHARRQQIFCRLADLSFGMLMFLAADLEVTANVDGVAVDATDPRVEPAAKLDALLGAMAATTKAKLLREFVRPLLMSAAELLADLLGPDRACLALLLHRSPHAAVQQPAPAPAPSATPTLASPVPRRAANGSEYEGKLLQANNGNPSVWFVEGGKRRGIWAPHILLIRFKSEPVNGRWNNVFYVPPSVIDSIPMGQPLPSPYEGRLLQAGKTDAIAAATFGIVMGPAAGLGTGLLNLVPADPTVWHIVKGKRQGIGSEALLRSRYGATWEAGVMGNGHWSKVMLVPASLLKEFPIGPTETLVSSTGTSGGAPPGAPPG